MRSHFIELFYSGSAGIDYEIKFLLKFFGPVLTHCFAEGESNFCFTISLLLKKRTS